MCHICLANTETEKLDRLDICNDCMIRVKEKMKYHEEKTGKDTTE